MIAVFMSAMAGVFGVAQAGINKAIGDNWGFANALLLNGIVFLVCNFALCAAVYYFPKQFSSEYLMQGQLTQMRWFWVFPGIMGFFLVMGLAYSVMQVGAAQTFVISVAAQLVFGVLWDLAVEGREVAMTRIAGAGLALVGTFLATR